MLRQMRPRKSQLAPSSSLPPLNTLSQLSSTGVFSTLKYLSTIYCPLPVSLAFELSSQAEGGSDGLPTAQVDSGYASGTDGNVDDSENAGKFPGCFRTDAFERSHTERWLMGFLARADTLECLGLGETLTLAVDLGSCILQALLSPTAEEPQEPEEQNFSRHFSFSVNDGDLGADSRTIDVRLNDGLAGTNPTDPSDVGLQSWGASIVFSNLLCRSPSRFQLLQLKSQSLGTSPRIIELGAGTGLVSLVLGALLPSLGLVSSTVIATDYHPTVLENLKANVAANPASSESTCIEACSLDWSAPALKPPLDSPADILVATDVVYAPEHAIWLRDCAALLLKPDGVFWMMVTVRRNGRFEGTDQAVEEAFAHTTPHRRRRLAILGVDRIEKQKGVGRGDESEYKLYRIGWAEQ